MAEITNNILWIGSDRPTIQPYLDIVRIRLGREADYFNLADSGLLVAASTKYPLIIVRDIVGASEQFVREHNLQARDGPACSQELIRTMASKGLNSKTPIIAIGNPTGKYIVASKYIAAGANEFWNLLALELGEFEENVRRRLV